MQAITTIGLDIAKSVFQVHGVDADGQVIISRPVETLPGHSRFSRKCRHAWSYLVVCCLAVTASSLYGAT
jgi:hypothetical protein